MFGDGTTRRAAAVSGAITSPNQPGDQQVVVERHAPISRLVSIAGS